MNINNKTNSRWIPRGGLIKTKVIRVPDYLVSKILEFALLMDLEYENGIDDLRLVKVSKGYKIILQKNSV